MNLRSGWAEILDHADDFIDLFQSVPSFCFGFFFWIGNQLGIKRSTVPILLLVRHDLSSELARNLLLYQTRHSERSEESAASSSVIRLPDRPFPG